MAERLRSWTVYWEDVHMCAHACTHTHRVCNHLNSDLHSDHRALHQSTQHHMAVRSKACGEKGGA